MPSRNRQLPSSSSDKQLLEVYQAFMSDYVRSVNQTTLNVDIKGVRIGSAKYSRLAQINLESRIITFSRYAIENVPERARRYLVLHELAHVLEPSHNRLFWEIVSRHEPDYRQVGKVIQSAFAANVKAALNLGHSTDAALLGLSLYAQDHLDNWQDGETGIIEGGWDEQD
jgi:predicted metal-dependent hydrolase